jgi:hypothetical protein
LWALIAISIAVAVVGLVMQGRPMIASPLAVLAGPLLIATAAVLVALAAYRVRGALIALILFSAADLGSYGLSYAVYSGTAPLEQFAVLADTPPQVADGRVAADPLRFDEEGLHVGNQMTLLGWQRADGYVGLAPDRLLDGRQLPALRVAGVRWVKRSAVTAPDEFIPSTDNHWLEVPRPLPRVRLVSRVTASDDPGRDIQEICVDTTALSELPLALPAAAPATARLVSERPGRLHIQVECRTAQLLVVAESFHSGWQATVDGQPEAVWRVNGDFMGCPVTAGQHAVVFDFRPRSLALGWLGTYLGLGLLIVGFCAGLFGPTTPREPEYLLP